MFEGNGGGDAMSASDSSAAFEVVRREYVGDRVNANTFYWWMRMPHSKARTKVYWWLSHRRRG